MLATCSSALLLVLSWAGAVSALRYDASESDWNLNQNATATDPLDYWGEWTGHNYTKSPDNWRFPYYSMTLDRYSNGDPTNDEANGTNFEHDWMSNQYRYGGDARGLMNNLDYIQGMGIKAIYLIGSPFLNQPWEADGYSPLDLTLLDHHHGVIDDWRDLIDAIHAKGMYVVLDNTMATMADLLSFVGYENATAPFEWAEFDYLWKTDRRYHDFTPGSGINESCVYPRFWDHDGWPLNNLSTVENGCRDSDFDHYGSVHDTGLYPVYQMQMGKFGSVQDHLREWQPSVMDKLKHFSCMQIAMFDLDGFRIDKALDTTVDALAEFSRYQRECARRYGKENFLVIGEVVGTNPDTAIFIGRGRQPDQYVTEMMDGFMASNTTNLTAYVREAGLSPLDASTFHYTVYAGLTRLLGMSGDIGADGVDFVGFWEMIVLDQDIVNVNTGAFDPRHLFGTTDQDIYRWPAIENGTQKQLLGLFISFLEMPGSPQVYYGEEQALYLLDTTSSNYVYGRQPMSSQRGWQLHGCFALTDNTYSNFPVGKAAEGCHDDGVGLDHKDPSHPVRNVLKRMFELRLQYPVLNDGFHLERLSSQTVDYYLNGSGIIPTPMGMWSIFRSRVANLTGQDFTGQGQGNQGVWLVYSNQNQTMNYTFDCHDSSDALVAPFVAGTTVKNLFYPYQEFTLGNSSVAFDRDNVTGFAGCFSNFSMDPWSYMAFVPVANFTEPGPTITGIVPSHDERIVSTVDIGEQQTLSIEIHFSIEMNCTAVLNSISINSTTQDGVTAYLNTNSTSYSCANVTANVTDLVGQPGTTFVFTGELEDVSHGIHTITVNNATTPSGTFTNAVDRFMFRIGATDNPVIFQASANYSSNLLHYNESTGSYYITPRAPGADKLRYSRTWGSSWSSWLDYTGNSVPLDAQVWAGTADQAWTGEHVTVQYWSQMAASAENMQHADYDYPTERRWPHAFVLGEWNTWGYDAGLDAAMTLSANGTWVFSMQAEWPTNTTINVWGMNPDGVADKTMLYGDVDEDNVLDWLHPDTLSNNVIMINDVPPMPYVGWQIVVNDGNYSYWFEPTGSAWHQLALSILLAVIPVITGFAVIWAFKQNYYRVMFNQVGIVEGGGLLSLIKRRIQPDASKDKEVAAAEARRSVLIATMEYEIEDWKIKIKIGGLGVMASLMGKALPHMDLIWVVPCVGGIDYPIDTVAEPIEITINGQLYHIDVQYHRLRNITFVLLDSPVFRERTKADPYPPRMDDLDSAVYYSAWNACIAEAIRRFNVDLYHINDYHGALAPLHLLPQTIPVSLSLHNAEFQGLWPLRSAKEMREIVDVFNLPEKVVRRYVQFGEVFNLLHAGASYLRLHQKGFGAIGVSKKYGTRALKRYPIFWGLKNIGALPNPDPADVAEWDATMSGSKNVKVEVDWEAEAQRGELRRQAQEWAHLEVNPDAQLFVFVGRWSMQKGVDLIADVFPALLDKYPDVQLMCIGPVIDLYGKFAALKLEKLMGRYPGRVYSKPEFTALPPFIFSGAEFALIPSRDEPFGLVAVEFGRKGALGVGSKVGGLGQMPGWWYTIESTATKHHLRQFRSAIEKALASDKNTRAMMRARASLQRFPVAQWVQDLEKLQKGSIEIHHRVADSGSIFDRRLSTATTVMTQTAVNTPVLESPEPSIFPTMPSTVASTRAPSLRGMRNDSMTSMSGAQTPGTQTPRSPSLRRNQHSFGSLVLTKLTALAEQENHEVPPLPDAEELEGLEMRSRREPTHTRQVSWHRSSDEKDQTEGTSPTNSMADMAPVHPGIKRSQSVLTLDTVVSGRKDFKLQNVDPFFNDERGRYYEDFARKLDAHKGSLSTDKLCIEEFLRRSEKQWFGHYHDAKLGNYTEVSEKSSEGGGQGVIGEIAGGGEGGKNEFGMSEDYEAPRGLRKLLMTKIGEWPLYAFFLAFGQIIAINSYQMTLLTGANGETANRLYIISSIFLGASIAWWFLFRFVRAVYVLSLPFLMYGAAFFMLGMTPYATSAVAQTWVPNVASGLYAAASASGFLFFTLNFASEGGTPVRAWVFRACAIQGTQQIFVAGLWYWGDYIAAQTDAGNPLGTVTTTSPIATAVTVPIAVLLWVVGAILLFGLPPHYRTKPGGVPAFYISLFRRNVVLWFFVCVIIQNYFLSAPYGRSWSYLWNSTAAPAWGIAILVIFFFVVVWALILALFGWLGAEHSWALPLFAIGLGAPRWCQMLWGVSGMGLYLAWPSALGSTQLVGALLGRALWLWLGVLDTLQGVGFGIILLQTLTRLHMTCAVGAAQVLGAAFTIAARASAPDAVGPGDVFPNLALDLVGGISKVWFWVPLGLQLVICVGFWVFFRKEQLFKP